MVPCYFSRVDKKSDKHNSGKIDIKITDRLADFLSFSNGAHLFGGELVFYGLRESYDRSPENRQPFSMVEPNVVERGPNMENDQIIFGGYFDDGSRLVLNQDGTVNRVPQKNGAPVLNSWSSFEEMMCCEINRMRALFNSIGLIIDRNAKVTP